MSGPFGGRVFVGAYWSARRESREEVAHRLTEFLSSISVQSDRLSEWFLTGASPTAAREPLARNEEAIGSTLRVNRRDVGGGLMPELGFGFSVWNGSDVSLSATLGAYSRRLRNSVVVSFTESPEDFEAEEWGALLEAAVRAFEPEYGVVTSAELLDEFGASSAWEVGWFTYASGGPVRRHSPESGAR